MPRYLLLDEAGALARCSAFTVRRAVRSGALASTRGAGSNGGRILITEAAALAWITAGCPSKPSPAPEGTPNAAKTTQGAA